MAEKENKDFMYSNKEREISFFRLRIEELKKEILELKEENKNLNFMLEKQFDWHLKKIQEEKQNY